MLRRDLRLTLGEKLDNLDTYVDISFFFMAFAVFTASGYEGQNYFYYAGFFLLFWMTVVKLAFRLRESSTVIFPYISFWTLAFLIICVISLFWAESKADAVRIISPLIQCTLITFMMSQHYATRDGLDRCMKILSLAGSMHILRILYATPFENWFKGQLGRSIGQNPNTTAMICLLCGLISFYYYDALRRKAYLIPALLQISFVVLIGSRKSAIAGAIGIVLLAIMNLRRRHYLIRLLLAVALVAAGLYIIYKVPAMYKVLGRRFDTMLTFFQTGSGDKSIYFRQYFITLARSLFYEHPLLGVGANNFCYHLGLIISRTGYAHNNYYEILADLGFVGFVVYYGFYVYLGVNLLNIFRSKNNLALLMLVLLLVIMICEVGIVMYYRTYFYMFMALPAMFIASHYGNPAENGYPYSAAQEAEAA